MQCPFCKEEIQEGAIKCKHCGSILDNSESPSSSVPVATASKGNVTALPSVGISVNNTLVWILAFAPIIGEVSQGLIAGLGFLIGLIANPYVSYKKLWFVTLILNIVLSLADEKKLKRQGIDTSQLGSAWLVPVYLYKRAQVLKQNIAYFIVWIVSFVLILLGF